MSNVALNTINNTYSRIKWQRCPCAVLHHRSSLLNFYHIFSVSLFSVFALLLVSNLLFFAFFLPIFQVIFLSFDRNVSIFPFLSLSWLVLRILNLKCSLLFFLFGAITFAGNLFNGLKRFANVGGIFKQLLPKLQGQLTQTSTNHLTLNNRSQFTQFISVQMRKKIPPSTSLNYLNIVKQPKEM